MGSIEDEGQLLRRSLQDEVGTTTGVVEGGEEGGVGGRKKGRDGGRDGGSGEGGDRGYRDDVDVNDDGGDV